MGIRRALLGFVVMIGVLTGLPTSAEARRGFTETDCEGMSDSVFRLYTAALGRPAEQGGFDFWLGEYEEARYSLVSAADFFVNSPEFKASYGALENRGFVERLYQNVLGRPGEKGGVDFWTGELDSGARSRALVLLDFSESPENVGRTATQIPSLGYFNRGVDGPWSCASQPADNTCAVESGFIGNTYDVTVRIPTDLGREHAKVTFDVFQNGTRLGSLSQTIDFAPPGDRVRQAANIGSAITEGVPNNELTCAITEVSGITRSFGGSPTFAPLDSAACSPGVRETLFGSLQIETSATNVLTVPGDIRMTLAIRVDGFRVDTTSDLERDVPPGAVSSGVAAVPGYLVPQGIDGRRVTCEVLQVYWVESD